MRVNFPCILASESVYVCVCSWVRYFIFFTIWFSIYFNVCVWLRTYKYFFSYKWIWKMALNCKRGNCLIAFKKRKCFLTIARKLIFYSKCVIRNFEQLLCHTHRSYYNNIARNSKHKKSNNNTKKGIQYLKYTS